MVPLLREVTPSMSPVMKGSEMRGVQMSANKQLSSSGDAKGSGG